MVARSRIGKVLRGKWSIERLLGVGGMADVYAAVHRNGLRVAVKVLRPELAASATMRKRFLREGYAANRVGHPGAVLVLDDDTDEDGSPFLVMELLDGRTLRAALKERGGTMPVAEVVRVFGAVLDIAAAAHGQGVVHRDIKPENIFLTADGRVKLLDFGIASLGQQGDEERITRSGATMGTPVFMAPEQARGRWAEVDGRTDVWSIGASMFTALTGAYVHEAATPSEVLIAAATQPAPKVRRLRRDVPPSVADVVDRALEFDPRARWDTARSMLEALSRGAAGAPRGEAQTAAPPLESGAEGAETTLPPSETGETGTLAPAGAETTLPPSETGETGTLARSEVTAGLPSSAVTEVSPDGPDDGSSPENRPCHDEEPRDRPRIDTRPRVAPGWRARRAVTAAIAALGAAVAVITVSLWRGPRPRETLPAAGSAAPRGPGDPSEAQAPSRAAPVLTAAESGPPATPVPSPVPVAPPRAAAKPALRAATSTSSAKTWSPAPDADGKGYAPAPSATEKDARPLPSTPRNPLDRPY